MIQLKLDFGSETYKSLWEKKSRFGLRNTAWNHMSVQVTAALASIETKRLHVVSNDRICSNWTALCAGNWATWPPKVSKQFSIQTKGKRFSWDVHCNCAVCALFYALSPFPKRLVTKNDYFMHLWYRNYENKQNTNQKRMLEMSDKIATAGRH